MHLPEGYTKIRLPRFEGCGLMDGKVEWDIPTRAIPWHLRRIGCRFIISYDPYAIRTLPEVREIDADNKAD